MTQAAILLLALVAICVGTVAGEKGGMRVYLCLPAASLAGLLAILVKDRAIRVGAASIGLLLLSLATYPFWNPLRKRS